MFNVGATPGRSGALSFGTSHSNGKYYDHLGSHDAHKDHTQVATDAPHVETGSVVGGSYTDATNSRYGRDHFVYKLGDKGEPVSVYAADLTTIEGGTPTSDSPAIRARPEALAAIGSDVFVQGVYYGKLTFPNAKAGGNIELVNSNTADQSGFYDLWVAKLDMSTTPPSAAWVVSPGDFQVKTRGAGIAVTAAGHVLTFHDDEKAKNGVVTKYSGVDGAVVWEKNFGKAIATFRDTKMSTSGEKVYLTGSFKGKDSTTYAPALATMTSCDDGEKVSAVVAEFDVAPADGPVAKWVTNIGCGGSKYGAKGTFIEGDFLYVVGESSEASVVPHVATSTAAACTMTGELGGFLVKLNKADGKCVWAKDLGAAKRVVANAVSVWTMYSDDDPYKFDAEHIVKPADRDVIMGRFDASNGVGLWGSLVGGPARDYAYDMDMTPTGPVTVGYSKSDSLTVGAVTATNLQNQAASAVKAGDVGHYAMFAMQLSTTDVAPACLTCGAGGDLLSATVNANKCYADGQCIDRDSFSTANPCFRCDPDTADKSLTKVLDNHCFLDGKCIAKDFPRPAFKSYNTNR